jgi:hypothetical protein
MGAGVRNATTGRLVTAAGGLFATGLPEPSTLLRTGSTATMCDTGATASSLAGIDTTFRATGRAFTNVSRDTTVTPPFTPRFAYVMLFTVVVRLTTTLL